MSSQHPVPPRRALARISRGSTIVLAVVAAAGITTWFARAQTLPADAQSTCTVTTNGAPAFPTWFESGTVTPNGVVKPADSLNFIEHPNCSFYQWSYQMFLWATSPAPLSYGGGGGRIFESPAFFDVSPLDADKNRTFIPHTNNLIKRLSVRAAQVGRHGLPVIVDKRGRLFEIEEPKKAATGNPLILNRAGRQVEVSRVTLSADRKPIFMDKAGRQIQSPKAMLVRANLDRRLTVQRFMIDRIPVFLDPFGNVIDTEVGQADGGVLLAQNGSLIYYITSVNDVFAYFLTGTKNGGITPKPTHFPVNSTDLGKITTFATAHGKTFPDPNALAVEVKTAWIEATALPNPSDYITIRGTIPTYDTSNPNHWAVTGQKTTQLAMVGMHVVGSVKGHPEMVWATFEHFGNTPNADFQYNKTSGGNPTKITSSTAGTWLFCAPGCTSPFNQPRAVISSPGSDDIISVAPATIGPANTIRFKPFGGAFNANPNPVSTTSDAAASNTEIISINNNVLGQLLAGDIRKNYYMTGSTWSIGGATPSGNFGKPGNNTTVNGTVVGTSQLSNSTMETYQQLNTSWDQFGNNCFTCHVTATVSVSHMFCTPGVVPECSKGLKPLFP